MLLLLLALALMGASVAQDTTNTTWNGTHIITTSDRFRPGYPVVMLAEIFKGTKPVTITVTITYKKYEVNSTEQEIFKSSPVAVLPGPSKKIEFKIPEDIPTPENRWEGYYQIKCIGVGDELSFNYSAQISRDDKSSAILITSDKAIYKPGETVKYRILALDPDSLRVKNVSMSYTFTDPNGNKMKIVQNAAGVATQGVVQDEFKLTDNTIRGDWKLTVEILGQKEEYTFTVDEYVLPRYEVNVKLPSYCVSSDSSVPVTITAKYTYGQPVAGATFSITIRQYQPYYWNGAKSQGIIRVGKLDKNGETSFNINSKELLTMIKSNNDYVTSLDWQQIEVVANVTEELTGRKQSGTAVTQFYQSRLKAEFLANTPNNYKEGMASTIFIELKQRDDTPLPKEELTAMQATFNVTYEVPLTDEEWEKQKNESMAQSNSSSSDAVNSKSIRGGIWYWRPSKTYILELKNPVQTPTENGFVVFTFTPPVGASSISIQVMFSKPYEADTIYKYMSKSNSPSNSFVSIVAPTEMPQVGKDLTLTVVATEPITHVTYEIISKGAIVDSGSAVSSTQGGSTSIPITIQITQRMPPSITIAVYYIRPQNSEVVVDALSLPVNGLFQTSVSMSFSPDKAEPGDPVDLIIDAAESSMIFVVANDKSVELLKSGNQLTQEKVQEAIATFAYGTFFPWFGVMFRCGFPYYNSGSDAESVFRRANILAFSDGNVYRKPYDFGNMNRLAESAAGNAAFGGAGATAKVPPKVRKNFPENWIWNVYTIKSTDGKYRETLTAPDTITKWNGYAFGVHSSFGLSVIKAPAELTTFRKMFVEVTLPYSLIRNEQFCMLARVFNYYTEPLSVLLTFENHPSFKNVFVQREGNSITTTDENMSTAEFLQDIEPNDFGSATFCFNATELGFIPINVRAETDQEGVSDALEQRILVKPEGVEESVNYPSLPDLTAGPTWTRNIALDFPADTVPGSQQVTASVTGNFLGPIYANIQDLVGKPYGCGEQNMLKFGPITYIHQFLSATKTITPEVEQKLKEYISAGFQTEQAYEHKTGGYSTFGENNGANASLWLSDYVVATYAAIQTTADEYDIDYGIGLTDPIARTVKFMISCQNENGSFTENGIIYHKDMQSGTGKGVALVAYTLIGLEKARKVLKNNPEIIEPITTAIKKATSYLINQINNDMTDPYSIIITAYAMHLLNDPSKDGLFDRMEKLSITEDGRKFWGSTNGESRDVEMTAYALLIYCLRGISQTNGLPIIMWLSDKRGTKGGFVSTQDTIVAIQALMCAGASLFGSADNPITFVISYTDWAGKQRSHEVKIDRTNESILQKITIDYKNNEPKNVTLKAYTDNGKTGPSTALVDVSLTYNVVGKNLPEYFKMSHVLNMTDDVVEIQITVSTANKEDTGMCILAIEIMAGFVIDPDEISKDTRISRFENDGEKLVLYLNTGVINGDDDTFTINMYSSGSGTMTEAKDRFYECYEYYFKDRKSRKPYVLESREHCAAVPNDGICQYA